MSELPAGSNANLEHELKQALDDLASCKQEIVNWEATAEYCKERTEVAEKQLLEKA